VRIFLEGFDEASVGYIHSEDRWKKVAGVDTADRSLRSEAGYASCKSEGSSVLEIEHLNV
jgi:hypothetical protein